MVSYQVLAMIVVGSVITVCVVTVGAMKLARMVHGMSLGAATQNAAQPMPETASLVPSGVDSTVLRAIGERLCVLEGSLPALRQTLDGYAAIEARIASLESRMPSLVDAYDRFTQVSLNSDKRRAAQQTRADKKSDDDQEISVEAAAAQMGMAGKATGTPQAQSQPAGKPPGVLGSGGNSRSGGVR